MTLKKLDLLLYNLLKNHKNEFLFADEIVGMLGAMDYKAVVNTMDRLMSIRISVTFMYENECYSFEEPLINGCSIMADGRSAYFIRDVVEVEINMLEVAINKCISSQKK